MKECKISFDVGEYLKRAGIPAWHFNLLEDMGYFSAPASKGHHLARSGGLAEHSANVTRRLVELTNGMRVEWPRIESPYLVGMLHDLIKAKSYRLIIGEAEGEVRIDRVQPPLPGHGAASAMLAMSKPLGIELYSSEVVAITYHMGSFGIGREYTQEEFDAAMKNFAPQILATHYADMWAAMVDEGRVNNVH